MKDIEEEWKKGNKDRKKQKRKNGRTK